MISFYLSVIQVKRYKGRVLILDIHLLDNFCLEAFFSGNNNKIMRAYEIGAFKNFKIYIQGIIHYQALRLL